ncbi:MAG: AGE family epimerase/isomerase [Planctomycetota bacterium]
MHVDRLKALLPLYRDQLLNETMPFWIDHAIDRECGGYQTLLDADGSLLDSDKSVWFQGRFAWLLGELYNTVEKRPEWLALCKHGLDFLDRFGFDPADGRMYFHLTREGRPIRKRRYAFSESFAAIAYGEYAQGAQDAHAAAKAEACFRRFVEHNLNPTGVEPKFTAERPTQGLGFPMIAIVTAQELRASIGLKDADAWIDRCIDRIRRFHLKPERRAVLEQVGPGGEIHDHFDGRLLNPGHAIEAAWFILKEGDHRQDTGLIRMGCEILDWMFERGWDREFGGMLYFVDLDGKPPQEYWHDMKFWWPQNETIIAALYAYVLTGDEKYARMHAQVHDWAYSHFPDPQHGEWFGYLHRDGSVAMRLKGSLWKGPFHYPRQQLVCWRLVERRLHDIQKS